MVIARVAVQRSSVLRLFALLLFGLSLPDYFDYFGYFYSFDSLDSLGDWAVEGCSLARCSGYS